MGLLVYGQPFIKESGERFMYTISSIVEDMSRGCVANNLNEEYFSYRIIFFVNEGRNRKKHYIDTLYGDLRKSLENIIREHLSVTNSVVIAQITTLKNGKCVSLLGKSYAFSLEEYFHQIYGTCKSDSGNRNITYGRYAYAAR